MNASAQGTLDDGDHRGGIRLGVGSERSCDFPTRYFFTEITGRRRKRGNNVSMGVSTGVTISLAVFNLKSLLPFIFFFVRFNPGVSIGVSMGVSVSSAVFKLKSV
jgi:hypothetical protein